MSNVEPKIGARRGRPMEAIVPRLFARDRDDIKSRIRVVPILITLGTVAVAALLAWATWQVYMGCALDARRHGAGLCRHDGARGGRTNRQAAGRG